MLYAPLIVSIAKHRLLHIYADIDAAIDGDGVTIGKLVRDVHDVWQSTVGEIVRAGDDSLWLDRSEHDIPLAYLAQSVSSFQRLCQLRCAASELACVRRSEQHRLQAAIAAFDTWAREHDPRVLTDEGSYWLEMAESDA